MFRFIVFFIVLMIPSFIMSHYFWVEYYLESNANLRIYWKIAFIYFAFTLIISPILKFIKNKLIRENLILIRKVFWILTFVFFIIHGFMYFNIEYFYSSQYSPDISYLSYVFKNIIYRNDALSWLIAWIFILILWVTSNNISVKLLWWKLWKSIHSLAYPAFLLTLIHIAFASRFDNFYIYLLLLVVWVRTVSYLINGWDNKKWKTTKYICIPCWYIYDEKLWDPDSGIRPWTRFKDISDDWTCPVCGVTKKDFKILK